MRTVTEADGVQTMFHVTSAANRASILANGLDWRLMRDARGIAGSRVPEQQGCFLCIGEFDADLFVRMNNTGGPVDVWEVLGVREFELVQSPEGFYYLPRTIPAEQLRLVRTEKPRNPW